MSYVKEPVFLGSSAALITPFTGGEVDYKALLRLINIQRIAGSQAVTVCGTTGEAATMTREERYGVIRFAVSNARGMKVIAGVGSNSTARTLENALMAQEAGADALLAVTPYYNKTTQRGLIEHYTYIADRAAKPIIIYNVPSRTGMSVTAETCGVLSRHPMINGIKEASGSLPLTTDIINRCGNNFNVWSGNDNIIVPMMSIGAKGVISVAANIAPMEITRLAQLCLEGHYKSAAKLQIMLQPLINALFCEVNPIPVKYAAERLGLCSGSLRLPLTELDREHKELVSEELERLGML